MITLTTLSLIFAATPAALAAPGFTVKLYKTQLVSEDGSSVKALANNLIKVNCPNGSALSQFNFARASGKILYKFSCISHKGISQNLISRSNAWTAMGSGLSTIFLDRQNVACPGEYGIKSFVLKYHGNQLSYDYVCVKIDARSCNSKTTPLASNGGKEEVVYLDRQNVQAEKDQFLQQFQLSTRGANYVYNYKTCSINDPPKPAPVLPVPAELRLRNTDNQVGYKRRFR